MNSKKYSDNMKGAILLTIFIIFISLLLFVIIISCKKDVFSIKDILFHISTTNLIRHIYILKNILMFVLTTIWIPLICVLILWFSSAHYKKDIQYKNKFKFITWYVLLITIVAYLSFFSWKYISPIVTVITVGIIPFWGTITSAYDIDTVKISDIQNFEEDFNKILTDIFSKDINTEFELNKLDNWPIQKDANYKRKLGQFIKSEIMRKYPNEIETLDKTSQSHQMYKLIKKD